MSAYVVFEWNQVGGRVTLRPELFEDDIHSAVQSAKDLIGGSRSRGRRDRYTVHEVAEVPVWSDYEDSDG